MKQIIALALGLMMFGAANGQSVSAELKAAAAAKKAAAMRPGITGTITDSHREPVKGVKAFLYGADSTIIGSGYTDAAGHYETNSVPAGVYMLKLEYPSTKTALITGIALKKVQLTLNMRMDAPTEDSLIHYSEIAPKPVVVKKPAVSVKK
jgi:hypothetical protein